MSDAQRGVLEKKRKKQKLDTMRAAVCEAPQKFVLKEAQIRAPKEKEVLILLEGCGVCGSNFAVWEGRPWFSYPLEPGAPGHEGWGRVEEVGSLVKTLKKGDRVSFISAHAFAQYDTVEESCCVKLPRELDSIPFPGEPLGCAMNVFERSDIQKGHTVAVIGAGFLGAILVALSVNAGANVIAISRRRFALDIVGNLGALTIEMSDRQETVKKVKEICGEGGCDRVIEATGFQLPLDIASELTKIRGKLIIAGYHQDGIRTVNMQLWNWRGIDVINAHERDDSRYVSGIKAGAEAVIKKKINLVPLITHSFGIKELNKAFELMRDRPKGFLKSVVIL
jgi:NADPH2:quinone reductase